MASIVPGMDGVAIKGVVGIPLGIAMACDGDALACGDRMAAGAATGTIANELAAGGAAPPGAATGA